jgi:lipopolysaccharide heptosyltransferase II
MEHAEHSYLFLNEKIPPVDMNMHAVDREKILLAAIGVPPEGEYKLFISEESEKELAALLTEAGIDIDKPLIAINPMTTWPTKHWHNKGFAELADQLIRRSMAVVFTGGKSDAAGINDIICLMEEKGAYSLAGMTTLKTLAALYKRAKVVVSTDTGPMHIAAATGTPVVAIFGPTAPWRTGPYGKQHTVVRLDIACSPCLKKQCKLGTHACMAEIDSAMVMECLETILERF